MDKRTRLAHKLRALRRTWLSAGQRGKWARFRMSWLMDKRLRIRDFNLVP